MCTESCWKMGGVGGKGVREINGRSWMDQSKVYPQWAYNESLWTLT
jgi:hypothetical protein